MNCWRRICEWFARDEPDLWEDSYPAAPDGLECPDTQPTSPGLLDTLPGRLE